MNYKDFTDYGYCECSAWGGHQNLPNGYWVYVCPNWYIWGEETPKDK